MRILLFILMLPLFILSQELTYVPDDNFETYLETYFPACDNGIDNDDYVLTSGLYGGGENPYECINLTPQTLDAPIFDLTGLEDFQGGIKGMRIEQQLIQNLNLAMFKFMSESTASCNYVAYGNGDLLISQCTLLEEILLPSDTIALSISSCPLLDNVYFPNDISLNYVAITGVNMCELKIRGQGLIYSQAYPFIISLGGIGLSATNLTQIDLSELEIPYPSTFSIYNYTAPSAENFSQINFIGPDLYSWTDVTLLGSPTAEGEFCVQVENPLYASNSTYWTTTYASTNYQTNCYNAIDCNATNYVYGCTDLNSGNYDPNANVDDGSCEPVTLGCNDEIACNFDESANTNDTSCVYPGDECEIVILTPMLPIIEEGTYNNQCECISNSICSDVNACNYGFDQECSYVGDSCILEIDIMTGEYLEGVYGSNCDCVAENTCTPYSIVCNYGTNQEEVSWYIQDSSSGENVAFGGAPYNGEVCLENQCYILVLNDTGGDGWNNNFLVIGDQSFTLNSGFFGYEEWCPEDISGCTDSNACNYDSSATIDDGFCLYPGDWCDAVVLYNDECECGGPIQTGCADETACNYGISFDGFEVLNITTMNIELLGAYETPPYCLSPGDSCNVMAPLYLDPLPNNSIDLASGAITSFYGYSGIIDADCNCICTNPENLYNYNMSTFNLDLSLECPCTDSASCNYLSDGECAYAGDGCEIIMFTPSGTLTEDGTYNEECECVQNPSNQCLDESACNYLNTYWCGDDPCAYPGDLCDNPYYFYDENCNCNPMFLPIVCEDISACNYGDTLPFLPPDNPWFGGGSGYLIYDSNCNIISEEPCLFGEECVELGCTNEIACNYDSSASIDDDSCLFPGDLCEDEGVLNNNCECITPSTECTYYPVTITGGENQEEISWFIIDSSGEGVASGGAPFVEEICLEDECYIIYMQDSGGDGWGGNNLVIGTQTFTLNDGSGAYYDLCFDEIYGCTNPNAYNYNSQANVDDGTCFETCPPLLFTNISPNPINDTELTVEWTGGCPDLNTIYLTFANATQNISVINANWENDNALLPNTGTHTWNIPCELLEEGNEYKYYIAQLYNGTYYQSNFSGPNPGWESVVENGGSTILTNDPIYWGENFEGNPGGNPCVGSVADFPNVPEEYVCLQTDFFEHSDQSLGFNLAVESQLCILGCTDPLACNYNVDANQDDNSCEYESCACDTVFITEYVTDTIYITDTIIETEFIEIILTEYLDCDTGLPCDSVVGMPEIINQSSTNGKIYNLLGQEIIQKDGFYIEGGEVKYRIK